MSNAKNNSIEKGANKDIKYPIGSLAIIIFSFLLAILDMILLYHSVGKLGLGQSRFMQMMLAFIIATIANANALMWGYENGKNLAKKSLNKKTALSFIFWVLIGGFYAYAKIHEYEGTPDKSLIDSIPELAILAISYIGSGTLIASNAAKIFNRKLADARKFEKRFKIMHEDLASEVAEIRRLTETLENYDKTYKSLDKQRDIIKKSILRSEKASMSSIAEKIIEQNPEVTAINVYAVRDEFLAKRKQEDEENL